MIFLPEQGSGFGPGPSPTPRLTVPPQPKGSAAPSPPDHQGGPRTRAASAEAPQAPPPQAAPGAGEAPTGCRPLPAGEAPGPAALWPSGELRREAPHPATPPSRGGTRESACAARGRAHTPAHSARGGLGWGLAPAQCGGTAREGRGGGGRRGPCHPRAPLRAPSPSRRRRLWPGPTRLGAAPRDSGRAAKKREGGGCPVSAERRRA